MTRLVEHPPILFSARAVLDGTVGGTWRSTATKLVALAAAGVLLALALPAPASAWITEGGSNRHTFATRQGVPPPYETVWLKRVRYERGGLLEHGITIAGGRIYAMTLAGTVVALSQATGKEIWRHDLPGRFATSPSYFRGRVYLQTHTGRHARRTVVLFALDAETGRTAWIRILRAAHSEGSPNIVNGDIYIGTVNRHQRTGLIISGAVRSYTLSGRLRWKRATCGTGQPPVWTGRLLVAADRCGIVRAYTTRGRVVWRTRIASAVGAQLAYAAGKVIVHAKAGIVYALRARSGRHIWSKRVGWDTGYPDCSVTRYRVVCGNYDGTVAAFGARRGGQFWRRNYGGRLLGAVVATRGMLWIAPINRRTGRGRVLGLNPRTGNVRLSFHSGRYDPAAAHGDWVYIVHSRHIRALQRA
jgi:outer membrane protein assembly factor BamB